MNFFCSQKFYLESVSVYLKVGVGNASVAREIVIIITCLPYFKESFIVRGTGSGWEYLNAIDSEIQIGRNAMHLKILGPKKNSAPEWSASLKIEKIKTYRMLHAYWFSLGWPVSLVDSRKSIV